jgi:hypothetical protein
MNKLILIPVEGAPREVPPEEYGALEYGSPKLKYMYGAIDCSTIEHLSVLFNGAVAHLFFDEEGLLNAAKLPNDRASAIAANRRLRGARLEKFRYNDMAVEPPSAFATLMATDVLIVGDALLWTGEME